MLEGAPVSPTSLSDVSGTGDSEDSRGLWRRVFAVDSAASSMSGSACDNIDVSYVIFYFTDGSICVGLTARLLRAESMIVAKFQRGYVKRIKLG